MPRKQKKYHYIYKTTCKVTGKFYVGMHSTDNLEDGYLGSGKILGYSRHKYGDENHVREILFYCSSRDELKQKEREVVNEELLKDPLNINLKYGGDGGWDHIDGSHLTKEIRSRGGKIAGPMNAKAMNSKASVEKRSRTLSLKKYDRVGTTGLKFSNDTRTKMSQSGSGEKNSQFGTCWVTDGVKPIKIKKEQLDEYIQLGYSKGRKLFG